MEFVVELQLARLLIVLFTWVWRRSALTQTLNTELSRDQTPSIQCTSTAQTPYIQSSTTTQTPSIQSTSTAQVPYIQSSTTAQTPSIQSTSTAQAPYIQSSTTAQTPSIQSTSTAQAPYIQSSTTAQTPSIQSTITAQTPFIQSTSTAQTPSTTAQTPCIQSTSTAQTQSIQSNTTAQSSCIQSTSTAQTPSIQSPITAQTPCIQSTTTAQAPTVQSTSIAQTPFIQSFATRQHTTPSATAQTPCIQSTTTAQNQSIQSMATCPIPSIQSTTTAQTSSIQSSKTAQSGGNIIDLTVSSSVIGSLNYNFNYHSEGQKSVTSETSNDVDSLRKVCTGLKASFKQKFGMIDDTAVEGKQIPLEDVYTELYITEGESDSINIEHEIWQIERASQVQKSHDTSINCNDILTPSNNAKKSRVILTKGIAGIGKSVSVQKFILDWAENKANQDVDFVFYLPFRELNLHKGDCSLHKLLQNFHPELEDLKNPSTMLYSSCKIVLILDGLDESRLPFEQNHVLSSVTEKASLDVLITNILKGNLLSSAQIWVTSRPEAAVKIAKCPHRVTEIRGFTNKQKEEYFRKKIKNETLANKIISHIKASRSLHIMCHIPVFCNILVSVATEREKVTPKTLTEMYIHFLIIQARSDSSKRGENLGLDPVMILKSNKSLILKLAKLAFEELMKGNLIFSEKELIDFDSDLTKVLTSTGLCTAIFKRNCRMYKEKFYSFIHMSFQEFLAALHIFLAYVEKDKQTLEIFLGSSTQCENMSLQELLKHAVDKALVITHGSLDLFLRFLLGISLPANQFFLQALLTHREDNAEAIKSTCKYIKSIKRKDISPERCINLFLCLLEMDDNTLQDEIQEYLQSDKQSTKELTPAHCSALAYMLLMSEEVLDEINLKNYNTSVEGRRRLIPAVKCCSKALLADCELSEKSIDSVALALQLANSHLEELDLSYNDARASFRMRNEDSILGVSLLSDGLQSSNCKLVILRLVCCHLNEESCEALAAALNLESSCLKELDLSNNELQNSGVKKLSSGLKSAYCKLEKLRLIRCNLTESSCETLASVLSSGSTLLELNVSNNDLQDSGVELLSNGLESPDCKLKILWLSGCMITEKGCSSLASALKSKPSHLRKLDLSYNHPGESREELLSCCKLELLNTDHGGQERIKPGLMKYAYDLTLDPNTSNDNLWLSEDNRRVEHREEKFEYINHRERFEFCNQVLCKEPLSGHHYWEVKWYKKMIIGVAYKGINRKGRGDDCSLGFNDKSWSLVCDKFYPSVCHNSKSTVKRGTTSSQVGVYLDWPAGTVSFYGVSAQNKLTHIHTFQSKFTEPLYAGFKFGVPQSSVSICNMK